MFEKELKFAQIIDSGACLSTINSMNQFKWKDQEIQFKAGKSEWIKHNFYPKIGMVGEIVDNFRNTLWDLMSTY